MSEIEQRLIELQDRLLGGEDVDRLDLINALSAAQSMISYQSSALRAQSRR